MNPIARMLAPVPLFVRRHPTKGRIVRAGGPIHAGTIIEIAPVIIVDNRWPARHRLGEWAYWWTDDHAAIALGYGSLYSHSFDPNMTWRRAFAKQTIMYRARRDIARGEELTINYNGPVHNKDPMDFEVSE